VTSDETRGIIEKAADDRRMHRCRVDLIDGDVPQATTHYGQTTTPDLIVVETQLSGDELLSGLDSLAENCDADTHVLLIGADNDIIQYRSLISRGISDYLLKPLQIGSLIEAAEHIFEDPDAPKLAKMIAFFGAEGGVGSSAVAHNVAWAMGQELGEDVTVVDLDLCFGTAAFAYNLEVAQGVEDMLDAPDRLDPQLFDRLLLRHSEKIGILGNRASLTSDADIDVEALEDVLNFVREQSGVVVVDLPHMWSEWVRQTLVAADEAVIIGNQELATLRDLKSIVEALNKERGEESQVKVVLNHTGISKKTEVPVKEFEEAVGAEPSIVVPHDPVVFGRAANNGQMVGDVSRKHKAAEAFVELAGLLTGRAQQAGGKAKKSKKAGISLFKKKI
tara:strand:- start:10699 stop:11871 length:1173 start_codon:yes stop_codon:yes gene_type:complete